MENLLSQLPDPGKLQELGDMGISPSSIGTDKLKSINMAGITDMVKDQGTSTAGSNIDISVPQDAPTKEGFLESINSNIDKLKAVNIDNLTENISSGSLTSVMDAPSFDFNGLLDSFKDKIVNVDISVPSIDLSDINIGLDNTDGLSSILDKLKSAGESAGTSALKIVMDTLKTFFETVSDKDKIISITQSSFQKVFESQAKTLKNSIPLEAVKRAEYLLNPSAGKFTIFYGELLNKLENVSDTHFSSIKPILEQAQEDVLPALREFEKLNKSLTSFKNGDTGKITKVIEDIHGFALSDNAILQPALDIVETKSQMILGQGGVLDVLNQFLAMADKIQEFLNTCETKGAEAAKSISDKITSSVSGISQFLEKLETEIKNIEVQISAFLDKIDVTPAVNKISDICNGFSEKMSDIFKQIEGVKVQLQDAVDCVSANIIDKKDEKGVIIEKAVLTVKLEEAQTKVKEFLSQISGVFNDPSVQDALNTAKQGTETFKRKIEEVSLDDVFTLVVNKTKGLETDIKGIDSESLGFPQKLALKAGSELLKNVDVPGIVKPELMEMFQSIQAPLIEIVSFIKDKVMYVKNLVDEFNPGTVAEKYIVESGAYKTIIDELESFKPSDLLSVLEEALDYVSGLVEKVNPDILISQIQGVFDNVSGLLDAIAPDCLNKIIEDGVGVAVSQLSYIKDSGVNDVIATIKETISIDKLLESTGIKDIGKADFWQDIKDILSGAFLDNFSAALLDAETQIAKLAGDTDLSELAGLISEGAASIESLAGDKADILLSDALESINSLFANTDLQVEQKIGQFQVQLTLIQNTYANSPEISDLIAKLDPSPVLEIKQITADLANLDVNTVIAPYKTALAGTEKALAVINSDSLNTGAVQIFKSQISDPINQLISKLKEMLAPYAESINKITDILNTLGTLPAKIDANVSEVLDTAKQSIQTVLSETIDIINTARDTLITIISEVYENIKEKVNSFSPAALLNRFSQTSFIAEKDGMAEIARLIINPGTDPIASIIRGFFTDTQLQLLTSQETASTAELTEGNKDNLLNAVNSSLSKTDTADLFTAVLSGINSKKGTIEEEIKTLTADQRDQKIEKMSLSNRCSALITQLSKTKSAYSRSKSDVDLIRLNRVILEAAYVENYYFYMSVQSLHPYIVTMISALYPAEAAATIDKMYCEIVDKIKSLPSMMIKEPLDSEFDKIKNILNENFDIEGIFAAIESKLDLLDEDLGEGLDRIALVYNALLAALDDKV